MAEWKPIDTVPTLVPVQFLYRNTVYTGWFNPECADPDHPYHFIDETCLDGWNGLNADYPPSHWRELDTSVGAAPTSTFGG